MRQIRRVTLESSPCKVAIPLDPNGAAQNEYNIANNTYPQQSKKGRIHVNKVKGSTSYCPGAVSCDNTFIDVGSVGYPCGFSLGLAKQLHSTEQIKNEIGPDSKMG